MKRHEPEPYSYKEWVESARHAPDQNQVWRQHEQFAREHYRSDEPLFIDLGGEA